MSEAARKLLSELEVALEQLPEAEQEKQIGVYLEDLRQRREANGAEMEPYSSFAFLQEAKLDLPSDYSDTYEQRLYGEEGTGDA